MSIWFRCAALAAGLALFGVTIAGCDNTPALIREATGLSKDTLEGIAHNLRLPGRELPALEEKIPDTTVAHGVSGAVKGLDPSAANQVVANACQLAGINLGQPPPGYPNSAYVSNAENSLKAAQNSGDQSEEFAARAICNASEAADKLNS